MMEINPFPAIFKMVTSVKDGFTFECEGDTITFRLFGDNSCCEEITRGYYPAKSNSNTNDSKITSWKQVTKQDLPDEIQNLPDLCDDDNGDKFCELVAIELDFIDKKEHLVMANKHNGYYCHDVTIESRLKGLIFQTCI